MKFLSYGFNIINFFWQCKRKRTWANTGFEFYFGLNYLLAGKTDEAIEHFERTIEPGGNSLLEKAHWYLGNAYLFKEDGNALWKNFRK